MYVSECKQENDITKVRFFFFCQFFLWSETDYAMIFFSIMCILVRCVLCFVCIWRIVNISVDMKEAAKRIPCMPLYVHICRAVPCRVVWRLRLSSHVQFKVAGVRFFSLLINVICFGFFLFALVAADFRFQRRRNRRSRTVTRNRFSRPRIFRSFLNLRYFS